MLKQNIATQGRRLAIALWAVLTLHTTAVVAEPVHPQTNDAAAERIYAQLVSHLPASAVDEPVFIRSDLREIAGYLARYPDAVALVDRVAPMNWQMRYRPGRWVTAVAASQLSVRSVTVYIDTRMALRVFAKRACMKEPLRCARVPAEALMHELLHVEEIRGDQMHYLAERSVGLDSVQSAHESTVIARESLLAASMSDVDGVRRPRRATHNGSLYAVACATCIDNSAAVAGIAALDGRL